jgi:hypothetical protein
MTLASGSPSSPSPRQPAGYPAPEDDHLRTAAVAAGCRLERHLSKLASRAQLLADALVAGAGADCAGRTIRGAALTVVVVDLHLKLLALELLVCPISLGTGNVPHSERRTQ